MVLPGNRRVHRKPIERIASVLEPHTQRQAPTLRPAAEMLGVSRLSCGRGGEDPEAAVT